jgi:hypothetical protein
VIEHGRLIARGTPDELKKTLGTILEVRLSGATSVDVAAGLLDRLGIMSIIDDRD